MPETRDTYCSYCGTRYPEPLGYPRTCPGCGIRVWVVLQPIVDAERTGLLVVRRAIPPQIGMLALVGGFIEEHESWQHAGAREVREETGAIIDARALAPFWYASSEPWPNRILLFALAPPMPAAALPPFTHDAEASERGVIFGPGGLDEVFAFSTHIAAARRYFAERGVACGHDFAAR